MGFPGGSVVKNLPANVGDIVLIPGSEDTLEQEMAAHSSGKFHKQRSLVGTVHEVAKESDMT